MPELAFWILYVTPLLLKAFNTEASELDTCKYRSDESDVTETFCGIKDSKSTLLCPKGEVIVLKSVILAVKKKENCVKRIVDELFCCKSQDGDESYDGECLQKLWNGEDRQFYRKFLLEASQVCMERKNCTLDKDLFKNLQRKIPTTETHSSYFKIVHQCVRPPMRRVELCSSSSLVDKEIHIKGSKKSLLDKNGACTCIATSEKGGMISVKAVDVRPSHIPPYDLTGVNGLSITTKSANANLTALKLPLLGFKRIFEGKSANITLQANFPDNFVLWLKLEGDNDQMLNITCSEPGDHVTEATAVLGKVGSSVRVETVPGYWHAVFGACGAIITILIVILILGVVYICRYRKKQKQKRFRSNSYTTTKDYLDAYDPPYAAVHDIRPPGPPVKVCRSVSSQTLQRSYSRTPTLRSCQRSTSMRSLRERPPMAPPPPPPKPNRIQQENRMESYNRLERPLLLSRQDVEQLEVLLESKSAGTQRSRLCSVQGSNEGSGYDLPISVVSRSSGTSSSNQCYIHPCCFPKPECIYCMHSPFESAGKSVTESLLGHEDNTRQDQDDLLEHTEVTQALLVDHKEDENHNEFDSGSGTVAAV